MWLKNRAGLGHTAGTWQPLGSRLRGHWGAERLGSGLLGDGPALGHTRLREGHPCRRAPAPASHVTASPTSAPQETALCEDVKTLRGPRVQDLLHTVLERRARVKELAESRGHALHASLLMASFTRAVTQV